MEMGCAPVETVSWFRARSSPKGVTMKHILRVVGVALAFLWAADFAMAFTPGVPPLSGPGSVFRGTERDTPTQSQPKNTSQKSLIPACTKARHNEVLALLWPTLLCIMIAS